MESERGGGEGERERELERRTSGRIEIIESRKYIVPPLLANSDYRYAVFVDRSVNMRSSVQNLQP